MVALPAVWYGGLSMLLAVIPLTRRAGRDQVDGAFGQRMSPDPARPR
jgi:hypothetical protein